MQKSTSFKNVTSLRIFSREYFCFQKLESWKSAKRWPPYDYSLPPASRTGSPWTCWPRRSTPQSYDGLVRTLIPQLWLLPLHPWLTLPTQLFLLQKHMTVTLKSPKVARDSIGINTKPPVSQFAFKTRLTSGDELLLDLGRFEMLPDIERFKLFYGPKRPWCRDRIWIVSSLLHAKNSLCLHAKKSCPQTKKALSSCKKKAQGGVLFWNISVMSFTI